MKTVTQKTFSPIMITAKNVYSLVLILLLINVPLFGQTLQLVVPDSLRGRADAERQGTHDANNIRTLFYNYGMVGDYPPDPLRVDLSIFHSVEVPKGSGENYSDGTTPFVLSKITQRSGSTAYIMETGYRERQGTSPAHNRVMRFEPRPGYFQPDPNINKGRSVAMSNDPRTWPDKWIDKLTDGFDPGWSGSWNGYFGKRTDVADQESFTVYDDQYYDAWNYVPDNRDETRRGLGLRVEQRGFQWANPQAGNVIFFHYDISNEGTINYDDNIIFGLYMDSGVGGSGTGKDGIPESDDDNAYFDKTIGLNLVYTWDKNGNGMIGPTGYLGYSYLETPGNEFDAVDNDDDGIIDESRTSGPGQKIVGQQAIIDYVNAHYDVAKFEQFYSKIENMPAYRAGVWFTGDEDMDWVAEFHDTGEDGIFGTNDPGEKDGIPTRGEANFDKTDIDESDQIGLTGFKMNRIKAGNDNPNKEVDNIVFFDDGKEWPKRLYNIFSTPDSAFDKNLMILNYNIGFLFASGPFKLKAGNTERFSLALGFGANLRELRTTTKVVQQIYKANYQFAVPPPTPTLNAFAGDHFVTLTWDNASEKAFDPITLNNDFEGYRIYRSTDPAFLDPQVIYTGTGSGPMGKGKWLKQFDLINQYEGYSKTTIEGVAFFLGENTGLTHTYTDSTVVNGQKYFYGLTSYDRGVDSIDIYPSENSITVSQTLRGGTILAKNVVEVYPNPPVAGYTSASAFDVIHEQGPGFGTASIQIKNSEQVPDGHSFKVTFSGHSDSVKAQYYSLIDVTTSDTLFVNGNDFNGEGIGLISNGILPVLSTVDEVQYDSVKTGFTPSSQTDLKLTYKYGSSVSIRQRRISFPDNLEIIFDDVTVDTSRAQVGLPAIATKFKVVAKTDSGDVKMKFTFRDRNKSGTIDTAGEYINVMTYTFDKPTTPRDTWRFDVDVSHPSLTTAPKKGDVFNMALKIPFSPKDVFVFKTSGQKVDNSKAENDYNKKPYVVPNPYVGAASFEPQRFAVSGRGERKIEFRNLPDLAAIRIYTVNGELVQTLHHDGNITKGIVTWDLRSKDNLEVAPGLYIFHVASPQLADYIGKFAIIK